MGPAGPGQCSPGEEPGYLLLIAPAENGWDDQGGWGGRGGVRPLPDTGLARFLAMLSSALLQSGAAEGLHSGVVIQADV